MANAQERTPAGSEDEEFHMGSLVRMGSWGIGATAALFLAVLAGMSGPGSSRIDNAISALSGSGEPAIVTPIPTAAPAEAKTDNQPSLETRRLSEQVRLLAADRDRLLQRLTVVEHTLDDVTGSIKRQDADKSMPAPRDQQAAAAPMPPPWPASPQVTTPWSLPPAASVSEPEPVSALAESVSAPLPATPLPTRRPMAEQVQSEPRAHEIGRIAESVKPQTLDAPQRAAPAARLEPTTGRTVYGIDLGGAVSVDRLRLLWNAVRASQTGILNGLHPVASAREAKRGGRPDLRLVVGPLPTEADANRLCSALLDSGRFCEPTVFRGQRMISR